MGNKNDIRVVLGSLRYKSAPDTTLSFGVPLQQTMKELTEYDRSIDVGLEQLFIDERAKSDKFRPTSKFSIIFKNSYTGFTNYTPFEDNLYYVNESQAAAQQCLVGNNVVAWSGFPQFSEFDFIRTDNNVSGYTQPNGTILPPTNHLTFVNKSASSYNWSFYLSYPYENDTEKLLYAKDISGFSHNWKVSDGIPFTIIRGTNYNGRDLIQFQCPFKHGLQVGDYVVLNFSYTGRTIQNVFQVYTLGTNLLQYQETVFNIVDIGFTGNTFSNYRRGRFKKIILPTNSADTISKYYVRKHKILSNPDDVVLVKTGFEQNVFGSKRKYESSGFTPTKQARVSVKDGSPSYTLSFNKTYPIDGLIDNQKRPLSELFFTIVWKGYFGWTYNNDYPFKQGFEFNLPLDQGQPSIWWSRFDNRSNTTGLTFSSYSTIPGSIGVFSQNPLVFRYVNPLKVDDVLDGDLCEWNDYTQEERVISKIYHKIIYNQSNFDIQSQDPNNPLGYYYQPHYGLKIRVFSDYIEEESAQNLIGVPDYGYYSTTTNTFRWRDVYPYGFVDTTNLGVNHPFINGCHYPFGNYFFRIIPEGTNYREETITAQPIIDNCE